MRFGDLHLLNRGYRRTLQFYMTAPAPCPYLEGKRERKAFTNLAISDADSVHNTLTQFGFRRSQSIAYRPTCPNCNACRSVRVLVRDFDMTKRWRRVLSRNKDVIASPARNDARREQYRLLKKYLKTRHEEGGMSGMGFRDYASMVSDSPVQSLVIEYRLGEGPDAPLIGASISDILQDGLSMVYSFFDPDYSNRSLGTLMILEHISRAAELGLPHVYLGYWVKNSPKMDYKRSFQPLEVLSGDEWRLMDQTNNA